MNFKKLFAVTTLLSAVSVVITSSAYARQLDPSDETPHPRIATPATPQSKKAMTWRILDSRQGPGGSFNFLVGSDEKTNPYQGDTDTSETADLLCIKKENLPKPGNLPAATTTPGGALRGSWSGGRIFTQPGVQGSSLKSKEDADRLCDNVGKNFGIQGARMAEFHDGDQSAGWAGWDFWADGSKVILEGFDGNPSIFQRRFWVFINDQPNANPWP